MEIVGDEVSMDAMPALLRAAIEHVVMNPGEGHFDGEESTHEAPSDDGHLSDTGNESA